MVQKNFVPWQENFDAAEELRALAKNNDAATSENEKKRELEQSLAQAQNPLKSIRQDRETDLELNQNFF